MYMDEIKLFAKKKKPTKNKTGDTDTNRIQSQDIGMEFSIEKCAMLLMRNGKRQIMKQKQICQTKKESERSEKRKITRTWEYWKRTPLNNKIKNNK